MTTLHTFGCSFTYGLISKPDDFVGRTGERNRCEPWGNILANHLNIPHRNYAQPGSGNKQIACSVRKSMAKSGDIAIIAWSGPLRPFTWNNDREQYETWTANYGDLRIPAFETWDAIAGSNFPWQQILYEHETAIRATANYLSGRNIKFLMTSALMDYKQMDALEPQTKQDYLSWNWIEWDMFNNSLFDICTNTWLTGLCQGYSHENMFHEQHTIERNRPGIMDNDLLAECFHPSQTGHEKIAETLLPYLQDLLESPSNTQDQ